MELGDNYREGGDRGGCGIESGPASFQPSVLPFPLTINEHLACVNVHSPHTRKGGQNSDGGRGYKGHTHASVPPATFTAYLEPRSCPQNCNISLHYQTDKKCLNGELSRSGYPGGVAVWDGLDRVGTEQPSPSWVAAFPGLGFWVA